MFVPCQTRISAWVPSLSTHVWVTSYACSTVAQQTFMRQHGPRVTHYERPAAFLSTLIYWQWILSQYLPCLHSFQARPEADQLLNRSIFCWRQILLFYVRKPKINLCMSSKLKYTYLKRYACSKLAQKRFMRQGGPRVTYYERPRRISIDIQSLAQPEKADESCPSLPCLHSFQARVDHSRFCWIFPYRVAWVLSLSTHASRSTHVASGPAEAYATRWAQSHILWTPRRISIDIQSLAQPQKADESCPSLPCLHSFQARPEADQLLNRSRFWWVFLRHVRKSKNLCMSTKLKYTYLKRYACSKLAQQRLILQDGPRVTHDGRPAAFLSTRSHWHSNKKQMNLVSVFAMPPLFPG